MDKSLSLAAEFNAVVEKLSNEVGVRSWPSRILADIALTLMERAHKEESDLETDG